MSRDSLVRFSQAAIVAVLAAASAQARPVSIHLDGVDAEVTPVLISGPSVQDLFDFLAAHFTGCE